MRAVLVMDKDGFLRLEHPISPQEVRRRFLRLAMLRELGTPQPKPKRDAS